MAFKDSATNWLCNLGRLIFYRENEFWQRATLKPEWLAMALHYASHSATSHTGPLAVHRGVSSSWARGQSWGTLVAPPVTVTPSLGLWVLGREPESHRGPLCSPAPSSRPSSLRPLCPRRGQVLYYTARELGGSSAAEGVVGTARTYSPCHSHTSHSAQWRVGDPAVTALLQGNQVLPCEAVHMGRKKQRFN